MSLSILTEWEALESASAEENACFAAIGIFAGDTCLTEAEDAFVKRLRNSVHLSGYHLAEWLAWNWWRLRWEPKTNAPDWDMAHRLTTIGAGYVWPNISIVSDGERIVLIARPTEQRKSEPLRYISDAVVVFKPVEFENAVSVFIEKNSGKLKSENIADTNLHRIWNDVRAENSDPILRKYRKLEALLGFDPDEGNKSLVDRLIDDVDELGEGAVLELAATSSGRGRVLTVNDMKVIASDNGFDTRPNDAVSLSEPDLLPGIGNVPAWLRGAEAAKALRKQEKLGTGPIDDSCLTEISGVDAGVLARSGDSQEISFAIDQNDNSGRIYLRSKWETGRRFDLARILGDRIAGGADGHLFPATRAGTYRQKFQRSFSAEFLSPFDSVDDYMCGDYSEEMQEEVAYQFSVSPITIRTLLANHRRIDRNDWDWDHEGISTNA